MANHTVENPSPDTEREMPRKGPEHCIRCANPDAPHRAMIRVDPAPGSGWTRTKTEVRYCDKCWDIANRPELVERRGRKPAA